jgi:predicted glycosyltransferase
MRFVIDIQHASDVNFFRGAIERLQADGHQILLVYLGRGTLEEVTRCEYPELESVQVGRHASSRLGLYFRTGLFREWELARALAGRDLHAALGFPGFQTAMVGKLLGFKSLGAYDDPEHRPNFLLSRVWLDRFVLPEYLGYTGRNIVPFRGLKEWAYLCPRQFKPDASALTPFGLSPNGYVFVREVDPRSLNYLGQKEEIVRDLYDSGLSNEKVVLSLENKQRQAFFANWNVLQEPVRDIRSLLYFSRTVISNGDSMAREGAQLGVPSIYCGSRAMKANDVMYDLGLMRQLTDPRQILDELNRTVPSDEARAKTRARLDELWEDPTDVLVRELYELVKTGS